MNEDKRHVDELVDSEPPEVEEARPSRPPVYRGDGWRWWATLFLQPFLFLAAGAVLFAGLGVAQKWGWISAGPWTSSAGGGGHSEHRYICPMMCTPPQSEPGRCPVCAMELVPATQKADDSDPNAIRIDTVARRIANIRTAAVERMPFERDISAVGELKYDESTLKTISAYVDGRVDRLYADYTGVVVKKGDNLALMYSPELFSGQTELLLAKKSRGGTSNPLLQGPGSIDLYDSAKQKLLDLGMTRTQIAEVERRNKVDSRMHLAAPISGTVIEKGVVEGDHVKQGQVICKLADLSNLWLVVNLFPEDAALVHYGHKVTATVDSLPGREFAGRVVFIDPAVDSDTRTVGVRVMMPNPKGVLRVGDFATARISVGSLPPESPQRTVYDPELARKWISPRHPHVVSAGPGRCRVCGIDMVPASEFGFVSEPPQHAGVLVVPRRAVLMAGEHSVVYVETEQGRFEIRKVTLGPSNKDRVAILGGIKEGERVAVSGNFLIDSQMQLSGKPSLIDPMRIKPKPRQPDYSEVLAELPPADRTLATAQKVCPVADMPLGSMGLPIKVDVEGKSVFICCKGCRSRLVKEPKKYLSKLEAAKNGSAPEGEAPRMDLPPIGTPMLIEPDSEGAGPRSANPSESEQEKIDGALGKLAPADRTLARKQKLCPVAEMPLGSMGVPIKILLGQRPVFICCEGCRKALLASPTKYLAVLDKGATK